MSAPIYRDQLWQGASDPAVIRREGTGEWWMFYTQRRALLEGTGVEWVHGSRIGVAVSTNDGLSWHYRGVVDGLDEPGDTMLNTHWAPEIVRINGTYHLYLTWIKGTPNAWAGNQRHIIHFTSDDLEGWTRIGRIDVGSDAAIDAAVARTGDGRLRLWFKDEARESTTFGLVSDDGYAWEPEGVVIDGRPHEGVNVFELGGCYWLIADEWRGQAVYRSADGVSWTRQDALVLEKPGSDPEDHQVGRHADVVVVGDRAFVFYFTHPGWGGVELDAANAPEMRESVVHVAELTVEIVDGETVLRDDRDILHHPHPFLASPSLSSRDGGGR